MKRVRVSELVPGLTSAEDVYSFNNQLVVEKNTVLTDEIITRLEFYSVLSIRVNEDDGPNYTRFSEKESLDLELDELLGIGSGSTTSSTATTSTVSDSASVSTTPSSDSFSSTPTTLSYSERVKATKQFMEFQKSFVANTEALEGYLHDIIEKNSINTGVMLQSVTSLISKGTTTIGMFDMLHNMRSYDDLTYVHSMSVSLICNIFGRWLGYDGEELKILTLAGLLHDIGKIAIPENIIKKPSKLTNDEYAKIKQHTVEGYKILKGLPIDDRIKDAALLHHERCDGGGYPLSVNGEKIPEFAKIVAIADVYDAMTAARVYRGPLCPFKVIAIFEDEGLQKYDSKFILTFLNNIGQTYLNNRVRLNDGRLGDIVLIQRDAVSRPLIKLLDGTFINLNDVDRKALYIDALI
ncbi:MAG: HD-GYP domain-containing protein [Lachnospiraceae bacterium]|nr:HD-GYP domain-containing protein [Lachnospiraceae bacterium]